MHIWGSCISLGALADLGVVLVWGALADLGMKDLALVHGQCTDTQRELQALGFENCFLHFVPE